jgi:SAM-dependent methyltransferase
MAISTNAIEAFKKCRGLEFETVLDIGAGDGVHAALFRDLGKEVYTCDLGPSDYQGAYASLTIDKKFDLIWCSHTLEHQINVYNFLKKVAINLNEDGYFAVTVPPLKDEIVGGHVTLWNAGLLLYNLILAGFDCSEAMVKTYGYNISVIVKYKPIKVPPLKMDFGDIETLAPYFPMEVRNSFDGRIEELNW